MLRPALAGLLFLAAEGAFAAELVRIEITDLAFSPQEITVKAGDSVEWANNDVFDHTATASSGSWEVVITSKASGKLQFNEPGVFEYYCRFHPTMTGKVTVSGE